MKNVKLKAGIATAVLFSLLGLLYYGIATEAGWLAGALVITLAVVAGVILLGGLIHLAYTFFLALFDNYDDDDYY